MNLAGSGLNLFSSLLDTKVDIIDSDGFFVHYLRTYIILRIVMWYEWFWKDMTFRLNKPFVGFSCQKVRQPIWVLQKGTYYPKYFHYFLFLEHKACVVISTTFEFSRQNHSEVVLFRRILSKQQILAIKIVTFLA